ncbi:MAG: recombinase family protein [Bacteroidota bacterium]
MSKLDSFNSFLKKSTTKLPSGDNAVIYTRVSDSSQEDNTSLASQKKYCELFAQRKGLKIVEYFGGTFESAKTDDRKEFSKMLTYVKRSKDITYIIVYSYERFSRSGINGAQIADDLLKQYGVITLAVTQELDPTTVSGSFQQKIFFLFSQMDNELRRDKTVTGMRELLRKGYCPYGIPRGYVNLNKGKAIDQKIVLNDEAKLLRMAFLWKANENMSNINIVRKLETLGLKIDERRLANMFNNPFYCGLIVSKLLPNEIIEGNHEPMVSRELFLKANKIITDRRSYPISHKKEDGYLPLKRFMRCQNCDSTMTGYLVKKKNLYYYKCGTRGCKTNQSANKLHEQFKELIQSFQINPEYISFIKEGVKKLFETSFEEQFNNHKTLSSQLNEVKKKIESVEERYVIGELEKELYLKYTDKYKEEVSKIEQELSAFSIIRSNLENCLNLAVKICSNLRETWESARIESRMKLQNLMFPEGIIYNRETRQLRTKRVNSIFASIPQFTRVLNDKTKREITFYSDFPSQVAPSGLLPSAFYFQKNTYKPVISREIELCLNYIETNETPRN